MADTDDLYLELYDNCRKGITNKVAFYLQSGLNASWANMKDRNRSLLMATAWKDSEDACKALLEAKADVNHTDTAKMTALHICAKQNASKVARLLLDCNGVDPNAVAENNITPLMICADLGHLDIGLLLLKHPRIDLNIQSTRGFTALMKAVFENSKELALELISKPASNLTLATNGGFTVLHLCAQLGRQELAERIIGRLQNDQLLTDQIDKCTSQEFKCNSALALAALNGHVAMAELLLKAGADINTKNHDGATALDQVNRLGGSSGEMIKCLEKAAKLKSPVEQKYFDELCEAILSSSNQPVDEFLTPERDYSDKQVNSLLMLAAAVGKKDILHLLLEKIGGKSAVTGQGKATLLHAAIQSGSEECVKLLLERGASTSEQNDQGFNALHVCAEVNASEGTVVALLTKARDSNTLAKDAQAKDKSGHTPFDSAAVRGSIGTLRQLLEFQKSDDTSLEKLRKLAEEARQLEAAYVVEEFMPKRPGNEEDKLVNQLFKASMNRNIEEVKRLLNDKKALSLGKKLLDAKSQREPKWTALMATAWHDDEAICEILLDKGADPNVVADEALGITALHIAVQQNSHHVVVKLLSHGCNVDARSKDQRTPLIRAAWLDHREIGKLLLKKKASVNAQEQDGFSALHFCAQENLVEFAKMLIRYQADLELKTYHNKHSNTAFTIAAIRGHVEMLELLANVGANIYYESKKGSAIELAEKSHQVRAIQKLRELDEGRLNKWERYGKTNLDLMQSKIRLAHSVSECSTICVDQPNVSQIPVCPSVETEGHLNSSTEHQIRASEYSMRNTPRGICVIINNDEFLGGDSRTIRHGSLKDVDALIELFRDKLKFRVQLYRNLDAQDIEAVMQSAANKDRHARYDCFVAFIMSHGVNGKVYGSDNNPVHLSEIYERFRSCTSLEGKPKIFFVQACRIAGEANEDAPPPPPPPPPRPSGADSRGFCNTSDFLYAYSTSQGDYAVRNPMSGSVYVQTLCKVFTANYNDHHLLNMLQTVRRLMGLHHYYMTDSGVVFDNPTEESQLRSDVYFRDVTN